jgi:hypothetical protein
MLKVSSDGRKAALDMRLVDPALSQRGPTKISAPVPAALQLVFCGLATWSPAPTPNAANKAPPTPPPPRTCQRSRLQRRGPRHHRGCLQSLAVHGFLLLGSGASGHRHSASVGRHRHIACDTGKSVRSRPQ